MVLMEAFSRCAINTKVRGDKFGDFITKPIKEKFQEKILANMKAKDIFHKVLFFNRV